MGARWAAGGSRGSRAGGGKGAGRSGRSVTILTGGEGGNNVFSTAFLNQNGHFPLVSLSEMGKADVETFSLPRMGC